MANIALVRELIKAMHEAHRILIDAEEASSLDLELLTLAAFEAAEAYVREQIKFKDKQAWFSLSLDTYNAKKFDYYYKLAEFLTSRNPWIATIEAGEELHSVTKKPVYWLKMIVKRKPEETENWNEIYEEEN